MATTQLEQERWRSYFDHLSSVMSTQLAEIEVAALDIGDQIAAEWVPVNGVTYDPKDDILVVDLEGAQHVIRSPREVVVDEDNDGIHSIIVVCAEQHRHIIHLKAALVLPVA